MTKNHQLRFLITNKLLVLRHFLFRYVLLPANELFRNIMVYRKKARNRKTLKRFIRIWHWPCEKRFLILP